MPVTSIFETLQVYLGGFYVNDFNYLGRVWRVLAQADSPFRTTAQNVSDLKARNLSGEMVPLGSVMTLKDITGPDRIQRYNLYLAVIPMMLLLPQLTEDIPDFRLIAFALGKSVLFLITMYVVGTKIFPRVFSFLARWGSRELFFLATLGVALGVGFLTYQLGLSFAFGAFIAGMLLSETDFNHQALSDVSSLRDLFGLIFFVSVGMLFNPEFFIDHIGMILTLTFAFVSFKAFIIGAIVRLLGYSRLISWTAGLGLAQVGEFAFLIANTGSRMGKLTPDTYSLMISVTVLSMVLTPWLLKLAPQLHQFFSRSKKQPFTDHDLDLQEKLADHVIIIGGGAVGEYIAKVLSSLSVSYVIVEADHKEVLQLRDKELHAVFGDATHRVILQALKIEKAKLIVVTTTNDELLKIILPEIRELHSSLPTLVRVEEISDVREIYQLGIHGAVQPQLETGIEMVRQVLGILGTEEGKTAELLEKLRVQRYDAVENGFSE